MKMDKLIHLRAHPTAKDILLSVSDDFGQATLRVWDVAQRSATLQVSIEKASVGGLI
jgi:coronin-7